MHTTHMPELANYSVCLVATGETVIVTGCDMDTSVDGELTFSDDNGVRWKFAAGAWKYARRVEP